MRTRHFKLNSPLLLLTFKFDCGTAVARIQFKTSKLNAKAVELNAKLRYMVSGYTHIIIIYLFDSARQ